MLTACLCDPSETETLRNNIQYISPHLGPRGEGVFQLFKATNTRTKYLNS